MMEEDRERAGRPGTSAPAVELQNVRYSYDGGATWALDGVSLTVGATERLCLLGANGSGKSTLASLIAGLEAPDEGEVRLFGEPCFEKGVPDGDAYARARRRTGFVLQSPEDQIVTTVVAEDVAFGPMNLGVPADEIGGIVQRSLHHVAMQDYADADPGRLSGGQQQRVAIAGILAMDPELLVLDEPGARLDVRGRAGVMHVLEGLTHKRAIVHVTHFMDEALAADRVVVLEKGRVALDGAPADVLHDPARLEELGLEPPFGARLSQALAARGIDVAGVTDDEVLAAVVAQCGKVPAARGGGAA